MKKITNPGIYPGIPLAEYHSSCCEGPSISHSGLDTLLTESAAKYWYHSSLNADGVPTEATASMRLGRAAHHLFLGEAHFLKDYVRRPTALVGERWNSNRLVCKKWLSTAEKKGLTVLTEEQIDTITGMSKALHAEPMIERGLLTGKIEQSVFHLDRETSVWIKARPDALPNDHDLVDLKCVRSVRDKSIENAIFDYGYARQGALCCEALAAVRGVPLNFAGPGEGGFSWTLVFIETAPPYSVSIVTLRPETLKNAVRQNRAAIRLFAHCWKTKTWPGPGGHQRDARYVGLSLYKEAENDHMIALIEQQLAVG